MMKINELQVYEFYKTIFNVPLVNDEVYLLMSQARRKYLGEEREHIKRLLKHDPVIQRKFLRHQSVIYALQKTQQVYGAAKYSFIGDTLTKIPQDIITIYLDVSPKSMLKGWNKMSKEYSDYYYNSLISDEPEWEKFRRMDVSFVSNIHKSNTRKIRYILDIDEKNWETLRYFYDKFPEHVEWITETRGGFHLIFKTLDKKTRGMIGKYLHTELTTEKLNELKTELNPNPMTVVCGTTQGGFLTKRIVYDSVQDKLVYSIPDFDIATEYAMIKNKNILDKLADL